MKTILTLDLGTKTGWALYRDGLITSGTMDFKNNRFTSGGMKFLRFCKFLTETKNLCDGIDAIYYEEVHRHLGTAAAHAYGGFMAHLTAWADSYEILYDSVPVQTIKKHLTGKGNANKELMIKCVREKGFNPEDDNEADALALLLYVMDTK